MGISLLAAGSPIYAVLLSFCFYLLNLLVPIIPAVIIYRLFPGGRASGAKATGDSIEGSVGGWKIKAVGAWAAYVTAFALGAWVIKSTALPLIKAVGGASVWQIDSDFKFVDDKDNEISDTVDKLQLEPPEVKPWGKHATITVFSESLDPPDQIKMKMEGYDYQIVNLTDSERKDGKIHLPLITLKRLPPIATSGPAPTPLPPGQGPPPLSSNK
jgi:hypothetical protein